MQPNTTETLSEREKMSPKVQISSIGRSTKNKISFHSALSLNVRMIEIILCFLCLLIFFIWRSRTRQYPADFPPGPRHLFPFIGDPLFAIGVNDGVSGFRSMHQRFGPIVGYSFGGMKVVSINDFQILQQVICLPYILAYKPTPAVDWTKLV